MDISRKAIWLLEGSSKKDQAKFYLRILQVKKRQRTHQLVANKLLASLQEDVKKVQQEFTETKDTKKQVKLRKKIQTLQAKMEDLQKECTARQETYFSKVITPLLDTQETVEFLARIR